MVASRGPTSSLSTPPLSFSSLRSQQWTTQWTGFESTRSTPSAAWPRRGLLGPSSLPQKSFPRTSG